MRNQPTVQPFSLPLEQPLTTAHGEIDQRRGFLVGTKRPDTGHGIGEATPLPGWTESYEACESALREPPDAWDDVETTVGEERLSAPAARHGYRLAVFDAVARGRELPLAALFADRGSFPPPSDSVPANATIGDGTTTETVATACEAVESGFQTLKLKVGAKSLESDMDRVRAVHRAVDATVRVDANGAWDHQTAKTAVETLAALNVEYVEQPRPAAELSDLADLRGRGIDIAADESIRACGVGTVIDAGAADVAILKPLVLGGPDAAIDAARRLQDGGVDSVVTTTIDGAVARAGAVHVAAAVPGDRACGLATGSLLATDLGAGKDPVSVVDGHIAVPDGPGNVGAAYDDLLWD